jgi:hypothetical protein
VKIGDHQTEDGRNALEDDREGQQAQIHDAQGNPSVAYASSYRPAGGGRVVLADGVLHGPERINEGLLER